jgi:geranylgeranyl diphosphate synthase, type I
VADQVEVDPVPACPESFPELLSVVRRDVDRELNEIWEQARAEHLGHGEAVSRPLEAARALCLRGGKRLRAALVVVGHCVGAGHGAWQPALRLACAVELLQAYFLIHDDWMDRDRVRRGGPAVHAALEQHLGSEHLAACGAVLSGDYTLALATRVLASAGPTGGKWPALLGRFAQMQLDAVVGQKLDVLGDGKNLDEVYRLKTASYTVLGPIELGLVLGGADLPENTSMAAFAVPLGIAFQLRDDLIGAFGDSAVTGKPQGSDLRAGKRTLLVSTALELAAPADARRIQNAFGNATANQASIAAALAAIDGSGARERVEQRIQVLAVEARDALDAARFQPAARALLEGVRVALLERSQ